MKQTKVIWLYFEENDTTTTATVSVPFLVRKIHIKNASLSSENLGATGEYITITSDMVNNAPLATVFSNSNFSAGTVQDIEHQLWNPQAIQGEYNFTLWTASGNLYAPEGGYVGIMLIVEFNDANEP